MHVCFDTNQITEGVRGQPTGHDDVVTVQCTSRGPERPTA